MRPRKLAILWGWSTFTITFQHIYFSLPQRAVFFLLICRTIVFSFNSWFATTWQGGHVGGQNKRIFPRRIYMKIEFSSQRREVLLLLTTNMAAVTSRANQQYVNLVPGLFPFFKGKALGTRLLIWENKVLFVLLGILCAKDREEQIITTFSWAVLLSTIALD